MPLIGENFTQLTDLDPVLTEIFYQHYTQHDNVLAALFGGGDSDKAKETDLRIGGFGDPVEFEGRIEYETPTRGYEVEYSHTEYGKGFIIERKLMDDMQYPAIFASAQEMGVAFARKVAKDMASVFNNAFSTSYTGYDSKPLCEDDHPQSRTDSTAVDNELALALTSDNLETAITTMQGLGDDLGEEITIMPNILLVPRALRKKGMELTMSELTPESANNAINVHTGLNLMVSPYLSDTNAWFLIDGTMAQRYLKWYWRVRPEFSNEGDFDTMMRKYRGYMRYSYGWSDFRWIIGSNPS